MLHNATLRKFRQHSTLDVEFGAGLTSIVGPNNAGKTGLLKAILFALGGAPATGSRAEDLWSRPAGSPSECCVALELDMPGHGRVSVVRSQTAAKVLGEGKALLASGTRPVNSFIEQAFGLDLKNLRLLMYSPQGETQELVRMGSTELQKKVESLAQISVIDRVLDLVRSDISVWSGQLEILPETNDLPELVAARERTVKELAELEKVLEWRAAEDAQATALADAAVAARNAAIQAADTRAALDATLQRLDWFLSSNAVPLQEAVAKMNRLLAEVRALPNCDEALAALEEVKEHVAVLDADIKSAEDVMVRLADRQKYLNPLERDYPAHLAAEGAMLALQPQLKAAQRAYDAAKSARMEASSACKAYRDAIAASECPACRRPYDHAEDPETAQAKEQALQAVLAEAVAAEARCDGELTDLKIQEGALRQQLFNDRNLNMLLQLRDEVARLGEHSAIQDPELLDRLRTERAAAQHELDEAESTSAQAEATFRAWIESVGAHDKLEAQIKEAAGQRDAVLKEMALIPEVDVAAATAAADEATANAAAASIAFLNCRNDKNTAEANLTVLAGQIEELEAAKAKRNEIENSIADNKGLQAYLTKSRGRLSEDIWEGLLGYASSLIDSATSGRVTRVERAEDGGFLAHEGEEKVPVSELGGAYRSIVGLALRIALSRTFFGPNLPLLLDEPTADARDDTAAAIAGMLLSLGGQVISVTHRQGEAANAGAVVAIGEAA